jgi:hypothetical protein
MVIVGHTEHTRWFYVGCYADIIAAPFDSDHEARRSTSRGWSKKLSTEPTKAPGLQWSTNEIRDRSRHDGARRDRRQLVVRRRCSDAPRATDTSCRGASPAHRARHDDLQGDCA